MLATSYFYGCKTRSVKLREEHRLKVLENGVLGRISGPKREKVAGGWSNIRVIMSRRMAQNREKWRTHVNTVTKPRESDY